MGGWFWSGAGDQATTGVWRAIGLTGPILAALCLAALVTFALARRRRYRVDDSFGEADRQAVHDALAAAERRSVGEVLPVVVEESDAHPSANWLAALAFLLAGSALLALWWPTSPALWLPFQLLLGGIGYGLSRLLPGFKRLFVSEARATEVAEEQAFQEFFANGLHRTAGATGVLLFVSLFEHRVVVLADEGINARVGESAWVGVDDVVLAGIRRGSLRDGLIAGIALSGELLARHFPWQQGDRNEIPDRLIVRTRRSR